MESLVRQTQSFLKTILSRHTKLSSGDIKNTEPLSQYGIDSVMIISITRELEDSFGELTKTLFFEYQTLDELTDYFVANHALTLNKMFSEKNVPAEPLSHKTVLINEMPSESAPSLIPMAITDNTIEDIAIIGISGQFPMAKNMYEFWDNLKQGKDCITEVPKNRWDMDAYFSSDRTEEGSSYLKWGGFMEDYDKFDPLFFNISNLEAETLDPQERLFLQTVHHTLEDAGYTRFSLADKTVGVYVGAMWGQYQLYGVDKANAGSSYASIANRVSYFFNFTGPSIALDTMCSSSLATVHLACESIRNQECDLAIAGGVNITVHPNKYIFLSKTGFAASDGRCRSFGANGDGYVPGDGVGALLLKPLSAAKRDGDYIYGVIKATVINHGGKTNGYTIPNPKAHTKLIKKALDKAHINPRSISYIEAHGTGTALGDPIEIKGLTDAFKSFTVDQQFCAIGSVKSNIGHLESAAGFASMTKVLLQMHFKKLVPSIHSDILNPNIKFSETPFYVQQKLEEWKAPQYIENGQLTHAPRIAGISSFGAGGANAHILVEEYSNQKEKTFIAPPYLMILSAKNAERLNVSARNFIKYLKSDLRDFIATENAQEDKFSKKASLISTQDHVVQSLSKILSINPDFIDIDDDIADYNFNPDQFILFNDILNERLGINVSVNELKSKTTFRELIKTLETLTTDDDKNSIETDTLTYSIDQAMSRIAYTLQVGREQMPERLAIICESVEQLIENLETYLSGEEAENIFKSTKNPEAKQTVNPNNEELIHDLLLRKRYKKIAKLWCSGVTIPWASAYPEGVPTKMPLPLYPFAKERCWVSEPTLPLKEKQSSLISHAVSEINHLNRPDQLEKYFYAPDWQVIANSHFPLNKPSSLDAHKRILVIYPPEVAFVKNSLLKQLECFHAYEIILGQQTQLINKKAWEINIHESESINAVLDHMNDVDVIYFLGGITLCDVHEIDDKYFENMHLAGVTTLFRLVKYLQGHDNFKPSALKVITNQVFQVKEKEIIKPYAASIVGFSKSLAKELTTLNIGLYDLSLDSESISDITNQFKLALPYILHNSVEYSEYAIRDGQVFNRMLKPISIPPVRQLPFVSKGCYIIVGGTGNVGMKLSRYLGETCQANIIWLGRRPLDETIKQKMAEIQSYGASVEYYSVDVADFGSLDKTIADINAKVKPIEGVFHLAMDFEINRIKDLEEKALHNAMKAKVAGTYALQKVLQKYPPKFLALFSSGESFTGNIGWAAYAAGCNFMDALGLYLRKKASYDVHVFNWGFWDGNQRGNAEILAAKGIYPIKYEEGMEIVTRVISHHVSQVMALHVEDRVLALMGVSLDKTLPDDLPVKKIPQDAVDLSGPEAQPTPPVKNNVIFLDSKNQKELIEEVSDKVLEIIANVLKIEPSKFDKQADLANYGIDSLIVINVHKGLEDQFGKLPATLILQCQNIAEVAKYLVNNHYDQVMTSLKLQATSTIDNKPAVNDGAKIEPKFSEHLITPDTSEGDLELIAEIKFEEVEQFLKTYGERFKANTLYDKKNIKTISEQALIKNPMHLKQILVPTQSGKRVEVIILGEGTPLVFMPAVALTAPVWLYQFLALSKYYQIIVIHAPGYGLSEVVSPANTRMVGEVFMDVMKRIGINYPVHLIASCFGSIAAQYLAKEYSEQIASLVLCGGFYNNIGLPEVSPENLSIEELFQLVQVVANSIKADFDQIIVHAKNNAISVDLVQHYENTANLLLNSQCANPLVAMKYLNELLTLSTIGWLPLIKAPTLCITGSHDTIVNPDTAKILHSLIPHSDYYQVKGAGHYPFLTHVDEFNLLLRSFINQTNQAAQLKSKKHSKEKEIIKATVMPALV